MISFLQDLPTWLLWVWPLAASFMFYFIWNHPFTRNHFRNDFGWFIVALAVIPALGWVAAPVFGIFEVWNKFIRK